MMVVIGIYNISKFIILCGKGLLYSIKINFLNKNVIKKNLGESYEHWERRLKIHIIGIADLKVQQKEQKKY